MVWTLGFRGQGDCPFWEQDPEYDTPERRGALISRAIRRQYDMLQAVIPGAPCLTYLYGEITELYRQGHITFPPGVAKIWSDNGYGRMVSRRQGNHSMRIPSLPQPDEDGPHGIYYHATFHDLQASSHLTMLPVSTVLLVDELETAFEAGADDVLLINCGNVRPHVFTLDVFFASLWRDGKKSMPPSPRSRFPDAISPGRRNGQPPVSKASSMPPSATGLMKTTGQETNSTTIRPALWSAMSCAAKHVNLPRTCCGRRTGCHSRGKWPGSKR
ncbi:glycosyl hydrolase 115 family protein [Roseibium salinum]|nr:glycosyl hydrolase 115 family protein [Roseibium salinum]